MAQHKGAKLRPSDSSPPAGAKEDEGSSIVKRSTSDIEKLDIKWPTSPVSGWKFASALSKQVHDHQIWVKISLNL